MCVRELYIWQWNSCSAIGKQYWKDLHNGQKEVFSFGCSCMEAKKLPLLQSPLLRQSETWRLQTKPSSTNKSPTAGKQNECWRETQIFKYVLRYLIFNTHFLAKLQIQASQHRNIEMPNTGKHETKTIQNRWLKAFLSNSTATTLEIPCSTHPTNRKLLSEQHVSFTHWSLVHMARPIRTNPLQAWQGTSQNCGQSHLFINYF